MNDEEKLGCALLVVVLILGWLVGLASASAFAHLTVTWR